MCSEDKKNIEKVSFSREDGRFMKLALDLAKKGAGMTSPNPAVGAVIVKDGQIIGSGYHKKAGQAHAEIEAIDSCTDKNLLKGSTMYVTLEPCCIYGKVPPCTDSIISYGISTVVAAVPDPNPKIHGKGIKKLEEAGIRTKTGLMDKDASKQNEIFFKQITMNRPFITSKIAASLDGKTAAGTGQSKWITSDKSRNMVKRLRFEHDCILTGVGTVIADDPLFLPANCKISAGHGSYAPSPDGEPFIYPGKKYIRAILDSDLRTGINSKIAETANYIDTVIFTSERSGKDTAFNERRAGLESKNIKIIPVSGRMNYDKEKRDKNSQTNDSQAKKGQDKYDGGRYFLDIGQIIDVLYDQFGVTSIFLECGQILFTEFLKKNLIDKFIFFIAPKLIGSDSRFGIVSDLGLSDVSDAPLLRIDSVRKSGKDLMIVAYMQEKKSKEGKCLQEL
jgi:diaminohydroxyphosphoribosylaminopyrimidine deaminase / 5-amino-6-(5-phosphoribosylamino)uracil reductase